MQSILNDYLQNIGDQVRSRIESHVFFHVVLRLGTCEFVLYGAAENPAEWWSLPQSKQPGFSVWVHSHISSNSRGDTFDVTLVGLLDGFCHVFFPILYASFPSSQLCCHLIWANKTNIYKYDCNCTPDYAVFLDVHEFASCFQPLTSFKKSTCFEETCLDIGLAQRVTPMHARIVFM